MCARGRQDAEEMFRRRASARERGEAELPSATAGKPACGSCRGDLKGKCAVSRGFARFREEAAAQPLAERAFFARAGGKDAGRAFQGVFRRTPGSLAVLAYLPHLISFQNKNVHRENPQGGQNMFKSYTMELGGRPLTLEFGKYAEQAAGSTLSATATPSCWSTPPSPTPPPGHRLLPAGRGL